jgi:alkyl sulfatase BDS1-like metallo-beta-lactamase superfamily hydrolase
MGRRTFLKGAVVGTGAVATGIGKEAFGGEGSLPAKVDKSPKPKAATATTRTANAKLLGRLPFASKQDMEDATRGLIAPLPNNGVITNEKGEPVWDMRKFQFILDQEKAPDTVNPSLWRQSRLVMQGGLFKVVDGLYQVRNADLSNLTIVEGRTGIILVDPLISVETAKAAVELYYQHRPRKPVVAVVHSHSHVDHYGGVRGVVSEDDVKAGKAKIVAPEGFLEAAVAENVLAGNAMSRRASYMYGNLLPPSPVGQVGAGLGTTTSTGTITLIPPTDIITKTGQKMNIDGLDFEFLMAPDSEAPSEMHWYIEQFKAVTCAENCCHTLHNTYSLRGAKIRDPLAWSKYLDESLDMWGEKTEVMYGMHHWPVWGNGRVKEMITMARDGYRYINDQTLRLANHGYTPNEIAEMLEFPNELQQHWAMRGYYGSLYHNVKATYVKYLGWFDGNPSHLHVLQPVDAAKKYVEFMGGENAVIKKAKKAYDQGEYRWVAEVMSHVVFANPDNAAAKQLNADALEQMGYQAESGPWRNIYLTGAKELREGVMKLPAGNTASPDTVRAMSLDLFFDYLGMRLNGPKAAGKHITLNLVFPDTKDRIVLSLENGALSHTQNGQIKDADATVTIPRAVLNNIVLGDTTLKNELDSGRVSIQGKTESVNELVSMLDKFDFWFNIVTP